MTIAEGSSRYFSLFRDEQRHMSSVEACCHPEVSAGLRRLQYQIRASGRRLPDPNPQTAIMMALNLPQMSTHYSRIVSILGSRLLKQRSCRVLMPCYLCSQDQDRLGLGMPISVFTNVPRTVSFCEAASTFLFPRDFRSFSLTTSADSSPTHQGKHVFNIQNVI